MSGFGLGDRQSRARTLRRPDGYGLLAVRPGPAGLWQVSGRNNLLLTEARSGLDVSYARRQDFWVSISRSIIAPSSDLLPMEQGRPY